MSISRPLLLFGALAVVAAMAASLAGASAWIWGPALLAVFALIAVSAATRPQANGPGGTTAPGAPVSAADDNAALIPLDVLDYPAMTVSPAWKVVAANGPALALFGQRIVGADLRLRVRHPAVVELVRAALSGESPPPREIANLGVQGGSFCAQAAWVGGPRVLLSFTDMTRERLTDRMRVDFVANASHELRTPLANIAGFIETCQGPAANDDAARQRFLGIMQAEAERMARLIDDLMSLSRIELDKHVRPDRPVSLAPLLHEVERAFGGKAAADGRSLLIEVAGGLPDVAADRDQILQVLHNLVSNALKYGAPETPVTITAALDLSNPAEPMVRVSVVDRGAGIAAEHLPRLTERFYRVDTGRSRSIGGTGLGLAIVKHIIERHRGRMEISSREGEGTTVSFLLPAIAAEAVTKLQ